ncbi:hypothetical protein [Streptomyces sp. NPDC056707]|uniref:hypothetical protein n=1 Tax=Streptomyces sp. NPDC056707 TaxID=3345919 RepID=UPI0036A8599A
MDTWIAFWTALWVGSSQISRRIIDWLFGVPRPSKPVAAAAPEKAPAPDPGSATVGAGAEQPGKTKSTTATGGGTALRILVVVLAALFINGLPYTKRIAVTLAIAWVLAAAALGLVAARAEKPSPAKDDDQEEGQEEPAAPDPAETLTRDDVTPLLDGLLRESGGVHLKTLAQALPKRPRNTPWETRDVRALLTRLEVRVRAGVRVDGGGGLEGVHRDDIPPLTPPTYEGNPVAVVAPGQSNNNNESNDESGRPFQIEDDPENPVRHRVRHAIK